MPTLRHPSLLVLGALGLCLTAGACKDDPPTPKLFDEAGAWSVVYYDLDGEGDLKEITSDPRQDAFMLSFDSAERVVTTAACISDDERTVANSQCLLSPSDTYWSCRCFAYDFVREEMLWREFNAGDIPPDVSLSASEQPPAGEGSGSGGSGGGTAGGGGGAGGDGDTHLMVSEFMEGIGSTYNFRPLPEDVFGSNGETSRFVMQQRAPSVFRRAFEDTERPTCEPCVP